MRARTVFFSLLVHVALAVFLLSRAEIRHKRKAISVAVTGEKAKEAAKPKPPPPPPPKPVVHHAPKAPPPPKAEPAPEPAPVKAAAKAAPAPVETKVALSNADLQPGGVALAGTPKLDKAAATPVPVKARPVKVAQADETRKRSKGDDEKAEETCDEEPTKPKPVFKTDIEYPAAAREQGVEGKLKLKIVVDENGAVSDVVVMQGVEASLDAVAIAAVKQWRFEPARRCGKPVAGGTYVFAQVFELAN